MQTHYTHAGVCARVRVRAAFRHRNKNRNENNTVNHARPGGRKLEGVHLANGYEEEGRRGMKIEWGRTGEGGWEATELYHNKFCTVAQQVILKRVIFLLL